MTWHRLPFHCDMGHQGTVLEIAMQADGTLLVSGLCVVCGVDVHRVFNTPQCIGACAVADHCAEEDPTLTMLRAFQAGKGLVN